MNVEIDFIAHEPAIARKVLLELFRIADGLGKSDGWCEGDYVPEDRLVAPVPVLEHLMVGDWLAFAFKSFQIDEFIFSDCLIRVLKFDENINIVVDFDLDGGSAEEQRLVRVIDGWSKALASRTGVDQTAIQLS